MTARPALERLDEFIAELQKIRDTQDPLVQAKEIRAIDRRARAVLGHAGDEAVFLAANELVGTRRRTHQEVADALGVTRYRVSNAITDYRGWVTSVGGPIMNDELNGPSAVAYWAECSELDEAGHGRPCRSPIAFANQGDRAQWLQQHIDATGHKPRLWTGTTPRKQ